MRLSNSYYGICNALSGLKILIISYGRLQITHNNIPLPFPVFQTEFMNDPFHPGGLKAPWLFESPSSRRFVGQHYIIYKGGGSKTVWKTGFFNNRGRLSPWNT